GRGAEASQAHHEEVRPTADDRHRPASRLFCGDERGRQRRSPRGWWPPQQSGGELASAVSTTRARHAALSKYEAGRSSAQFTPRSTTISIRSAISSLGASTSRSARPHWRSGAPLRLKCRLSVGVLRQESRNRSLL